MGSAASAGLGEALEATSSDDIAATLKEMPAEVVLKVQAALSGDAGAAPEGKGKGKGKPQIEPLDNPFVDFGSETVGVDVKDDPSHPILFEDEECCVRVYEPCFSKPGEKSAVHIHDEFTAYIFQGHPDKPVVDTAMEMCQEIPGGGLKGLAAFKMLGMPGGTCNCLYFPHPQFGERIVHRVGIPASFPDQSSERQPFKQLGCEVKKWPKAATAEALTGMASGLPRRKSEVYGSQPSLPAPYTIPAMAPATTKFQQWRLELRPGSMLPAHAFTFPAMIMCGCGGGGKLKATARGPSDSPLIGLTQGKFKWLPTGCEKVGPLELPADASEPFVVTVIELLKGGLQ